MGVDTSELIRLYFNKVEKKRNTGLKKAIIILLFEQQKGSKTWITGE